MNIGVPKEIHRHEHRVGLTPFAVSRLVSEGHRVYVEARAGEAAHFTDLHYREAGAEIVYSSEEAYKRADLVCRVGLLSTPELDLLKPGLIICAFHHLAVTPRENVEWLMKLGTTLIGYEVIRDEAGDIPVLDPMSEMAGQMAIPIAAHYLQTEAGGRGVLVGNIAGVPPPTVLILGAGTVGTAAARSAVGQGVHVIVLDDDMRKLWTLHRRLSGRVVTALATPDNLARYTSMADVVIGAVLIPGERAPFLVTEEMVRAMKPGSVVLDISIDQGGCVETSRPTTLGDPVFMAHGVIHYCVPNMTANVPRTASRALSNAALPYLRALASRGLDAALREDAGLGAGVYLYRGRLVKETVGQVLGIPATPLPELLGGEA